MAVHPDVCKRMRDEVLETHGTDTLPTYESLRNLKYSTSLLAPSTFSPLTLPPQVRAVLNETLRLFPPVPLNIRESRPEAVALPPSPSSSEAYVPTPKAPLYMPGGTPIMYMPMLMQRNPDLWGADADAFDPARWLDPARLAKVTGNPMMFLPFSAGPRIVSPILRT